MLKLGKTLSEWESLSELDRAWAIQTQRTIDGMTGYDIQLQNDEIERLKRKKGKP
jgi:hypothetical protein